MSVLFIVPTYGHFDYAHIAVASFLRSVPDGHVFLSDDASPDANELDSSWFWDGIPKDRVSVSRRTESGGVTKAWNDGLTFAGSHGYAYAICGNSDVICSEGFLQPLLRAADTYQLAGPVTNTPGSTNPYAQSVKTHMPAYQLSDEIDDIDYTAYWLRNSLHPLMVLETPINGFFMAGRTQAWWTDPYDGRHVFDPTPKFRMQGSEDELQKRWSQRGHKFAVVPRSFVFHYRSVSRGEKYARGLWLRRRR